MGIPGLLKALDPLVEKRVPLSRFKGKVVAIDGFAWLHRGCVYVVASRWWVGSAAALSLCMECNRLYACAIEAARGIVTPVGLSLFMRRLKLLRRQGIKPLVVLDGGRPLVKVRFVLWCICFCGDGVSCLVLT